MTSTPLRNALALTGLGLVVIAGRPVDAQDLVKLEARFRVPSMEDRALTGPLFWLHGDETPERLEAYLKKVAEGGNGSFTAESRPHSDWLGPGWYRDLAICLDAAKRLGLKMWIFDEKWWPSGEVAGNVPQEYGSKYIEVRPVDVSGPADLVLSVPTERLVAVLIGRAVGEAVDGGSLVDLTPRLCDGEVQWPVPAGAWRVMIFTWQYDGGRAGRLLVDGASREAVDWYIETVYQPHFDHFGNDFGDTIQGYFYDEPETHGDWGTEVIPMLQERGVDWKRALVAWKLTLTDPEEQVAARYQYQDAFAEAWGRTLYGGLTDWCREHDVLSIGHWLEHNREYLHPRLCAGNVFQTLKYSSMGGIDAVFTQFVPGRKDDNTYQTPKLGSSVSHAYGAKDDLAMVEIFGARGQDLTYEEMKWWTDHMHSSGINFHIPHSFNPRAPYDTDCPPYFYNGGYEPRWPLYRVYADYTTRLTLMLTGGRHVCPVALLYLGNSYHVGASVPPEEMTTALQDALYDCDWLPYDVFEQTADIRGRELALRDERYRVLIVPCAEVVPYKTLEKVKQYFDQGGIVIGYGMLPSKSATLGRTAEDIAALRNRIWGHGAKVGLEVCLTNDRGGRSYFLPQTPTVEAIQRVLAGDAGIVPTLEVVEGDTGEWLHVLHRQKGGRDMFFITNMNIDGERRTFRLRAHALGYPEVWDAMRAEVTAVPYSRSGDAADLTLELESGESVLLVFSPQRRTLPLRLTQSEADRLERLPVRRVATDEPIVLGAPEVEGGNPLEGAQWIWHAADPGQVPPCRRFFHITFEVERQPAQARLVLTADNEYRAYLDGDLIGQDTVWESHETYDVSSALTPGRHALAIEVTNGGTGPNPAGLVAALVADGLQIVTDGSWLSSDTAPEGWPATGFDDSAWAVVRVLGGFGIGPWGAAGAQLTVSPVASSDPFEGVARVRASVLTGGARVFLMADQIEPEQAARVTINGVDAGGFIGRPLRLDITRLLQPGANRVRVEPLAPDGVWLGLAPVK